MESHREVLRKIFVVFSSGFIGMFVDGRFQAVFPNYRRNNFGAVSRFRSP